MTEDEEIELDHLLWIPITEMNNWEYRRFVDLDSKKRKEIADSEVNP